jgi:hypothetical protein
MNAKSNTGSALLVIFTSIKGIYVLFCVEGIGADYFATGMNKRPNNQLVRQRKTRGRHVGEFV